MTRRNLYSWGWKRQCMSRDEGRRASLPPRRLDEFLSMREDQRCKHQDSSAVSLESIPEHEQFPAELPPQMPHELNELMSGMEAFTDRTLRPSQSTLTHMDG